MLGRALTEHLSAAGVDHLATGRDVDITDADGLRRFADENRPSHIVNCAAYTSVDDAERDVGAAEHVNGTGAANLAALAAERAISLLHVSTDYVFDGRASRPYATDAARAPLSVYGRTKLQGEDAVLATIAQGEARRVHVVRTSWLFGPGGRNFVTTMLRLMAERPTLQVVADQHGRPTFTRDLAAALFTLAVRTTAPSGAYHFANHGETTWHGFASAILAGARERGLPTVTEAIDAVDTAAFPRPAPRPAHSVLDTSRLEALGIVPRPWTEALGDYLDALA